MANVRQAYRSNKPPIFHDAARCAIRDMSCLTYGQGFTGWHYQAVATSFDDMIAPGFFNDARDMMKPGDHISLSAFDGGGVRYVRTSGNDGVVLEALR